MWKPGRIFNTTASLKGRLRAAGSADAYAATVTTSLPVGICEDATCAINAHAMALTATILASLIFTAQPSQGYLCADLLGNHARHNLQQIFTGFLQHEGASRFRPAQLEAGGERGNPYFAHWSIGRNYEFGRFGFLEEHFQFSAFAFHVEIEYVAGGEQAFFQVREGRVG